MYVERVEGNGKQKFKTLLIIPKSSFPDLADLVLLPCLLEHSFVVGV